MISPTCNPASSAGEFSSTESTFGGSYPITLVMTNANTNARIKLNIGPAATTLIRPQTDACPKEPGPSSSPSSPTIMQEPPIGNSFRE